MATPTPATPNFPFAEGFTLPTLGAEDIRIANEVLSVRHYTSAPIMDATTRERALGHAYPQRPVGSYACRGLVIHTLRREEAGIVADAIVAPPPEMDEAAFLKLCLDLSEPVMPEAGFEDRATPLRDVVTALGRTGIPAATGLHIAVDLRDPAISFAALAIPRVYIGEFGAQQSAESSHHYAVKTSAALSRYLTMKQLRALGA